MKSIDYSYFIERYINGEMEQAEKVWFEKELEDNDFLKSEIALRKKTDNLLKRHNMIDLRNKLAGIEKSRKAREIISINRKKAALRSAAAVAGFVIIGTMLLFINRSQTPEEIFRNNFTLYEPGGTVRNSVNSSGTEAVLYLKALELYRQGDFSGAAGLFREYLKNRPGHMEAHLVYGVTEMKISDYPEAEKSFNTIISDGNNMYIDNARWYLAQCYLKTNNSYAARKELLNISRSKNVFSKKAEKILRKLR